MSDMANSSEAEMIPKKKLAEPPVQDVCDSEGETDDSAFDGEQDASSHEYHDESHMPKRLIVHTGSRTRITSATALAKAVTGRRMSTARRPSIDISAGIAQTSGDALLSESRVLVLYTGGTIGMKNIDGVYCPEPHYLPQALRDSPDLNDKSYIDAYHADDNVQPYCLPPIPHMKKRIVYWVVEYHPLLDSSDMTFDDWIRIGKDIRQSYYQYDGFVVLHGTDTLAYTASALSFMFENLGKPVILTGAQIPVCEVRSDGRENLIGALIIAGNFDIPEVTVYFNNKLLRGNRSVKLDNSGLEAFDSPNMQPIARMEITIKVNYQSIFRSSSTAPFSVRDRLCRDVGVLRIFPSIPLNTVRAFLLPPTQGVVLETYGAGNMPSRRTDIIAEIRKAVERGCIIINCSQCVRGQVDVHYLTGKILYDAGVIPGSDMTCEAALTKLSYVLGKDEWDLAEKRRMMERNIRGEITVSKSATLQELEIIPELARFLCISSSEEVQLLRNALFPPLLCHAARNGDVDLLANLRDSGASFSAPDYNGLTPLHVAASAGHANAVHFLLAQGANVHARDQWDQNALMSAIRGKNLDCIRELRNAGAVIGCKSVELGIEMCLSASQKDLKTLAAWITAGADPNQPDYDGRTALHIASSNGCQEIVEYLLKHGANAEAVDKFGNTPISEAEAQNDMEMLNVLRAVHGPPPIPPVQFSFTDS
uniref:asparaginase n=1 Tax=Ascaris suum TaxID=6253 RepID=F1KVU4_ASCSU